DDNIIFAQNFFTVSSGNRYFSNSGISSLGHAVPAAIGARFYHQGPTIAILGDGGFQMCAMELMTAVNYRIPLTVVVFNNTTMGLIRKNQLQQYGGRLIDCDFINPDFGLLARSFSIAYHRVATANELDRMMAETDFHHGITLVEMVIDRDAFPDYRSGR
ncbi:MAG: thiamine pyrophosphate-binding protein, partial [Gammaproteobacteria bacterium]|nr:thiamine pyrophosphate-binding protein [Gammaproteobacteria bacterium]